MTARWLWQFGGMKIALILPLLVALALPAQANPAEDALREGLRLSREEDWPGAGAAVAARRPAPGDRVPVRGRLRGARGAGGPAVAATPAQAGNPRLIEPGAQALSCAARKRPAVR